MKLLFLVLNHYLAGLDAADLLPARQQVSRSHHPELAGIVPGVAIPL